MEESVLIAIKSGLSLIDTCLRDILQLTKPDSDSGNWLFKVRRSDLDDRTRNELANDAQRMLAEIRELQCKFQIGTHTESARWRVVNDINEIWSTLSELSEDKLGGYGQMQPEESRLLATHVSKMEAVRKEMERMVSG